MPISLSPVSVTDDDYESAHRLYPAACSIPPLVDGQRSPMTHRLLRAASTAWERHLRATALRKG